MKKSVRIAIIVLSLLSLILGIITGISRIQIENGRKKFQVAVKYSDVLSISSQTKEPYEKVLKELKEAGVTTLFVNENTVVSESNNDFASYKRQGKATYYEGYALKELFPESSEIQTTCNYIRALEAPVQDNIYNYFVQKGIRARIVEIEGKSFIEVSSIGSLLTSIGVGFNEGDLKLAAQMGYSLSPQIKSWVEPSEESITYVTEQLKKIPNLGPIYFSDAEIVGFESIAMQELISSAGIGFVEFFSDKQKGFATLAKTSSQNGQKYTVARLHTLADGELNTYKQQELLQRYMLALRERNINAFLFKLSSKGNIDVDKVELIDNITKFILEAEKNGYTLGNDAQPYNLNQPNYWRVLLVGIAAICIFILLCEEIGRGKIGIILGIIGFIGYAAVLKINLIAGAKLMALFGTICFPSYAVIKGISMKPGSIWGSIKAALITLAISLGGALTVVGTISITPFGLGVELFRGVKISFLMPLLLILLIIAYKQQYFSVKKVEKVIKNPITYGTMIILGVLAIIMLVYITKSGNSGQSLSIELQFRQFLNDTLGVRPRTKEFLIGYPILMLVVYYGYKEIYWPLVLLATMGQISVVNTYTHIHTPLMVSIIRSTYGVVIGTLLGIVLIYAVRYLQRFLCHALKREYSFEREEKSSSKKRMI